MSMLPTNLFQRKQCGQGIGFNIAIGVRSCGVQTVDDIQEASLAGKAFWNIACFNSGPQISQFERLGN